MSVLKILRKRRIDKIRKYLAKNCYPPKFDPKKWKNAQRGCNCYSYVLDIPVKDTSKDIWIPGCISNEDFDGDLWSPEHIVSNLERDLKSLGIQFRKDKSQLKKGEWRIAIYYISSYHDLPIEFHFARQDRDGKWSEKPSWNGKIESFTKKKDTPPDLSDYNLHLIKTLILCKKENE